MKCIILILFVFFNNNDAKEKELYKVSGADLIDLLRGFPTEQEALELEKVKGDKTHLPDGIYFEPEDEGLSDEGEKKYLNYKGKKTNDLDKKPVQPVPLRGHKSS